MTLLPSLVISVSMSQTNRLVAGSIPVVGSSSNSIDGSPTKAIAVLSFLLFPPLYITQTHSMNIFYIEKTTYLYVPDFLLACLIKSSRSISFWTTFLMDFSGTPLSLANIASSSRPVRVSMKASN